MCLFYAGAGKNMERDYHKELPWLEDAAAAAVSLIDAMEDFYRWDRHLLRGNCPRSLLVSRIAGWLDLALARQEIIDLYAADPVRFGGELHLSVRGRRQRKLLLAVEIRSGKTAGRPDFMKYCGPGKNQYRFAVRIIPVQRHYRLEWIFPDALLEEAIAADLYFRQQKAEFIRGAESATFRFRPREIAW